MNMMSSATHKHKKLQQQAPLCLTTKEESTGNNQHGDVFDTGLSRLLYSNIVSSTLDQNHCQTFRPMLLPPSPPVSNNITRKIIGIMVPFEACSGHKHSQNACCITNQKFRIHSFFHWFIFGLCKKDAWELGLSDFGKAKFAEWWSSIAFIFRCFFEEEDGIGLCSYLVF